MTDAQIERLRRDNDRLRRELEDLRAELKRLMKGRHPWWDRQPMKPNTGEPKRPNWHDY